MNWQSNAKHVHTELHKQKKVSIVATVCSITIEYCLSCSAILFCAVSYFQKIVLE